MKYWLLQFTSEAERNLFLTRAQVIILVKDLLFAKRREFYTLRTNNGCGIVRTVTGGQWAIKGQLHSHNSYEMTFSIVPTVCPFFVLVMSKCAGLSKFPIFNCLLVGF
jgi:hypothetical protein